jgi:Pyruvate/2-oxoacid:ferredoxin oxidoreductase gamma subunit
MVGALSAHADLPAAAWEQAMAGAVKPAHLELNRRAFESGRAYTLQHGRG